MYVYVCTSVSDYTKITGRGRGGRARNGLLYFYFCIVQRRTKDKEGESKREGHKASRSFSCRCRSREGWASAVVLLAVSVFANEYFILYYTFCCADRERE